MFGIGMSEMILICALALIVVGPDKLPELARSLAKGVMELKKTATGLKESLTDEISPALDVVKPELEEASRALKENLEQQHRLSSTTAYDDTSEEEALTEETGDEDATPSQPENQSTPSMTTDELIARAQNAKTNSHNKLEQDES